MPSGTVKWFNCEKGYGFITLDGQSSGEVFTHYTGIRGSGYRTLKVNQRVTFAIEQGAQGPQAVDVTTL